MIRFHGVLITVDLSDSSGFSDVLNMPAKNSTLSFVSIFLFSAIVKVMTTNHFSASSQRWLQLLERSVNGHNRERRRVRGH